MVSLIGLRIFLIHLILFYKPLISCLLFQISLLLQSSANDIVHKCYVFCHKYSLNVSIFHHRYLLVKEPFLGIFSFVPYVSSTSCLLLQIYLMPQYSAKYIAESFPPQIPLGQGTFPWLQLRHAINLHKVSLLL